MNSGVAKANRTEWTAVFITAAELTRLGYTVALTPGSRTPMADLMVGHPASGKQFWVDVKGMAKSSGGGWFMHVKEPLAGLFYILVSVGNDRADDSFFILSQAEANGMLQEYRDAHPDWDLRGEGFNRKMVASFADRWDILPR